MFIVYSDVTSRHTGLVDTALVDTDVRVVKKLRDADREGLTSEEVKLMEALISTMCVDAPGVSWNDVCGLNDVKVTLQVNILLPLQRPDLFENTARAEGFLLYGPPGTGKTLLARAVAADAKLPIFVVQPCNIIDKSIAMQPSKSFQAGAEPSSLLGVC